MVRIGAVATDNIRAVDIVILLLYKRCIGTAIGGKAAFQGGSGVNVLLLLFGQHHPHIAQVVFEEVVVGEAGNSILFTNPQSRLLSTLTSSGRLCGEVKVDNLPQEDKMALLRVIGGFFTGCKNQTGVCIVKY